MARIIDDVEQKEVNIGILMPLLKHKWILRFTGNRSLFSDESLDIMVKQFIACSVDYHLNTLKIVIQQDRHTTHLHDLVKRFSALAKVNKAEKHISFLLELMNGDKVNAYQFTGCKMIGHSFDLNYSESGAVDHVVKFSFEETKEL